MASFFQRLIPFRKRRRVRLAHEIPALSPRQRWMWRGGLGLAIFLATIFLFPLRVSIEPPEYLVGSISSEEIIAPFEFEVKKSQAEFEREQAVAAEGVKSIFTRDDQGIPVSRILAQLERSRRDPWLMSRMQDSLEVRFSRDLQTSLALPDTGRILVQALGESLSQIRTTGFVDAQDAQLLEQQGTVMLREGASQREVGASDLYDRNRVQALGERRGSELYGELGKQVLSELLAVFSSPNIFFDPAATNEARELAREQVNPVRGQVQRGERIIDSNVRITQEHALTLAALEQALQARAAGGGARSWIGPILGRMVLVSAFLILLAVFLRGTQREVWDNFSLLTLLGLISLITLGFAAAIVRTPDLSPFLIPSAFAGILVALLLNDIVALATVVWLTALISTVTGWGLPVALVGLVGGATAVFSVHGVKHRIGVYRSMLWIALANMAVVLGLRLIGGSGRSAGLLTELAWSMGSAGLFTALAMLSLPVFERSFDLATDISLLELSDLNRSIFKRMMIEANGTYHHSMVIGSLAEAAAEAVGANPLLARVGAYYHDIGKIAKSNYFGENLRRGSKNPHERLTPTMSSLILESHVREGLELAREIGLPKQVAAFIPEHQGTTLMQYFFTKAAETDPEVEEADYRYPGPKPQTKETAIVMLGDAAEATVRSLDEQTPMKIRAVLSKIFDLRIQDGQLDECGLTISDLTKVREAFTHVLTGVFHGRVKYQWQKDGGEDKLGGVGQSGERVIHPELETGLGTADIPKAYDSSSSQTD